MRIKMEKLPTWSKILHGIVLLCFLLPFFYTGCGPSAKEMAAKEKAKQDSIEAVRKAGIDTSSVKTIPEDTVKPLSDAEKLALLKDSIREKQALDSLDKTATENDDKEKNLSDIIVEKHPFFRPFLLPEPNTYTGLGQVINLLNYAFFCSLFISFLLLILGLLFRFTDKHARISVIILDFIALIFLFLSPAFFWAGDILWGYWLTFTLLGLLFLYDIFILIMQKRMLKRLTGNK